MGIRIAAKAGVVMVAIEDIEQVVEFSPEQAMEFGHKLIDAAHAAEDWHATEVEGVPV